MRRDIIKRNKFDIAEEERQNLEVCNRDLTEVYTNNTGIQSFNKKIKIIPNITYKKFSV